MKAMFSSPLLKPGLIALAVTLAMPLQGQAAETATGANLVDALQALGGPSAGLRKAHAHGVCFTGSFTPDSASAAAITKSPAYTASTSYPVSGRFSMGGPNPHAPDNAKEGRGLAVRLTPNADASMDLVLASTPMFAAATPDEFLELLTTVKSGDKEKIGAFMKTHDAPGRQHAWLEARPVYASFATTPYYGIHAFRFVNAAGKITMGKIVTTPVGEATGLSDAEAKAKGGDFLAAELAGRVAKGPAKIDVAVQIAEAGDSLNDPTKDWPDTRKTVHLGTLNIEKAGGTACVGEVFMPTAVTEGVELGTDPILPMRATAYAVSYGRRLSGK